jgi:hypothetical protein
MPVAPRASAVYNVTIGPRDRRPWVRGWNRLEGRPRSADFARSLRAEVRDPLWFLTRQWQFGEFEGDDAGSPIDARLAYHSIAIDGYATGDVVSPYDARMPLETVVEREAVPFDLVLHMQASRVLDRLLRERGREARLSDYVRSFPLDYANGVAGDDTPDARALFEAGTGFLFDAAQLVAAVRDGSHASHIAGFPGLTAAETQELGEAATALVTWFETTYAQPVAGSSAWRPEKLDYAFACTADGGSAKFAASDYRGGDLDWHAFDFSSTTAPAAPPPDTVLSFLPSAIRFTGMPSPRHWEMENGKTDFGALDVDANDVARLLLSEFALLFSNDWCLVPLELRVGTYTRISGVLVTDVFGDTTLVRGADQGAQSDWQRWSMFRQDGDAATDMGLLLAPALAGSLSSAAFEEVHFLRDEMANMAWAVLHRLASKTSEPLDPELGVDAPQPATPAVATYRLGQYVPANWRPFVPTHVPGSSRSIRLQRARMPSQSQASRGAILDVPAPYFVAEEEIPRTGRRITRTFQRTRWIDGTTWLWIGRAAPLGRGEGSSGLAFDSIEEGRATAP